MCWLPGSINLFSEVLFLEARRSAKLGGIFNALEVGMQEVLLTLVRWTHYVAGILWIGHLYFFNFVNSNLQADARYPGDMKKVVNPLLMTRALFMFRWGVMFTFLTGLYMVDALYNHGAVLLDAATNMKAAYMALGAGFGVIMWFNVCLLYTSDAADDLLRVDLCGRRL